jgi:hypothetical protein
MLASWLVHPKPAPLASSPNVDEVMYKTSNSHPIMKNAPHFGKKNINNPTG